MLPVRLTGYNASLKVALAHGQNSVEEVTSVNSWAGFVLTCCGEKSHVCFISDCNWRQNNFIFFFNNCLSYHSRDKGPEYTERHESRTRFIMSLKVPIRGGGGGSASGSTKAVILVRIDERWYTLQWLTQLGWWPISRNSIPTSQSWRPKGVSLQY